jgi:hypothetical protein
MDLQAEAAAGIYKKRIEETARPFTASRYRPRCLPSLLLHGRAADFYLRK